MNGVHAFLAGQPDNAIDVQVGLHGALSLADQVGFIGLEAVQARRSCSE